MIVSKWLNSLKIYSLSVIGVHFLLFTYFFPTVVFYTAFVTIAFYFFYCWCNLVHEIEESNRNNLLHLIETSTNEQTRSILCYELYLHDQNSIVGDRNLDINEHSIKMQQIVT